MATNRYSLSDYTLTVSIDDYEALPESIRGKSYSIGGPGTSTGNSGSFLGQIVIKRNEDAWKTEGDYTGSWIHNKNNNKTGTIEIDIRQVSDDILRLAQICKVYESVQESVPGFSVKVEAAYDINGNRTVAQGNDCYIQKLADITFKNEADTQTWTFTCGEVIEY